MMHKAVFFDIDGTLLDGSHGIFKMSEAVRQQIRQLQKNGDVVLLASGRPFAFLYEDLLQFGFDGFILMNGTCIKLRDKVIYRQPLPENYVRAVCRSCEENQIEYILEGEEYVYLHKDFHRLDAFYAALQMPRRYFRREFSLPEITGAICKIEFLPLNEAQRSLCRSFVTKDIDYMEDPKLNGHFELYAKRISKATAILKTLAYLHIDRKNSYAFGDGKNDREMLTTVHHGFAMGNASAEVQASAAHVVASVYDDGVAQGIAKYILA